MEILFKSDMVLIFPMKKQFMILREMMFAGLPIIAWNVPTINKDLNHQKQLLIKKGNFNLNKKKLYNLIKSKSTSLEISDIKKKYLEFIHWKICFLSF